MYYIGIDLGGTNIAAGIVNQDGGILIKESIPTNRERSHEEIVKDMAMLSLKLIKESNLKVEDVKCIGVGSPGAPDNKKGLILYNNNLRFKNVPIREIMRRYIDLPVFIENDANCAALAESIAGAAKGFDTSVTITIGTGIGSGIVINRKIYNGFNDAASELGHHVIDFDGIPCSCGRIGCWERYASATALIEQTREAAKRNPLSLINKYVKGDLNLIDAKTAFDAKREGDPAGIKVVEEYTKYLAVGIVNTINIFQPEILALGGGISKEGEYLLQPLRDMVEGKMYGRGIIKPTRIVKALMGNDAGIVGAAMLGL